MAFRSCCPTVQTGAFGYRLLYPTSGSFQAITHWSCDRSHALKPSHEQRWNPLIGLVGSVIIACVLIITIGPNPVLVGYLLFTGLIWLLLSSGVVDQ